MSFPAAPRDSEDGSPDAMRRTLRGIAAVVNRLLTGKLNNVTTLTLDANAASTTLTDSRLTSESHLSFMPTTANAAAEIGNGTLYIDESARVNGSVVITHANNAQTDRTFRITITG
jgi:hypothetical protein